MDKIKHQHEPKLKITGDWAIQVRNLKIKFYQLTNKDLKYEKGKENELLSRIEKRLKMSRNEVIELINDELPMRAGL